MTELVEPAPAAAAPDAGSSRPGGRQPGPSIQRDLGRVLACAALVAICVQSPASALAVAPFVPALVAIRLLRRSAAARVWSAIVVASIVAAALAAPRPEFVLPGVAGAMLLAWGLAQLHVWAALRDPVVAGSPAAWPEPRITSGFTPTVAGWCIAVAIVATLAWVSGAATSVVDVGTGAVATAHAPYADGCAQGGALADREDFCERMEELRDQLTDFVERRAAELFAAIAAIFAFGAAATAHLVVLARGRLVSDRVRPSWRLEQLELHWSFAYVLATGLVGWMLAVELDGAAAVAARAASVVLIALGGSAIVAQGLGLITWTTARGRRPMLVRGLTFLAFLLAWPVVAGMLFVFGVVDMAVHPRRRLDAAPRR
jgi:hypothetical protein